MAIGDKDQIHACSGGSQNAIHGAVVYTDGIHLHAVTDDQPLEAKRLFQQASDDCSGHGGRNAAAVQLGKKNMRCHDRGDSLLDQGAEGCQFTCHQFIQTLVYTGQAQVRIHAGVTVAREMLRGGQHVAVPEPARHLQQIRDSLFRTVAEAAYTNDWILRIGIDVCHGSKIEIHPQRAKLLGCELAAEVGVLWFSGSRNGHGTGDIGTVLAEPGDHTTLLVDGDKSIMAGSLPGLLLKLAAQFFQLVPAFDITPE